MFCYYKKSWILLSLILLLLAGCSSKGYESQDYDGEMMNGTVAQDYVEYASSPEEEKRGLLAGADEVQEQTEVQYDRAPSSSSPQEETSRKIIREQIIEQQVQNLKEVITEVEAKVSRFSGAYIESLHEWKKEGKDYTEHHAQLILRIPVNEFEDFLQQVESQGNIINRQVSGQDVTAEFVDNDSRLRNLKKHEERILSLYEKANTIEEMLKIENELSRIRESIERLEGRQKFLSQVTSTVKLTLELFQVEKELLEANQEDTSILREAWIGFKQSFKQIIAFGKKGFIVLVTMLPYLVLLALPITFLIYILRKFSRREDPKNM